MMREETVQTCVIWGIPFGNVTFTDTLDWIRRQIKSGESAYIATANMDFIMHAWSDPELQRILIEAGLVVADGAPIVKGSAQLGPALRERVTGSDLVPMIAGLAAKENFSVFLLGGATGVAEKAAEKLCSMHPGLQIAGCYSPPPATILDMDHDAILKVLRDAKPDILLVAFGAPKQEKWINMHFREWNIPVSIGIGGTFDFLAGTQFRAPRWVQKINLEWLWRMGSNPKRLASRYLGNIRFFLQLRRDLKRITDMDNTPDETWSVTDLKNLPATYLTWPPQELPQNKPVIMDLAKTEWMTSDELGRLLDSFRQHKEIYLVRVGSRLMALFNLYRLERYMLMPKSVTELTELLQSNVQHDTLSFTHSDDVLAIRLPAEITAVNTAAMRDLFQAAWDERGIKTLTLDAAAVTFLDSSGIGLLRHMKNRCMEHHVTFQCTGFNGDALTILKVSRVADYFTK